MEERSYVVRLADGTKTMLPVWMTEPAAADDITLSATPHVSIAALEAVRALLALIGLSANGEGRQ